jgi:hypothetical protein
MNTVDTSACGARPSFLDRARALVGSGRLAAVPLAVAAASVATEEAKASAMTVDYAAVTGYSNSGFFTGFFLDQTSVTGAVLGNTATLSGAKTVTDSYLFWRYDSIAGQTAPRYDTTGLALYFGGRLPSGVRQPEDLLRVNYDFTVDFEHTSTGEYDYPSISVLVVSGHDSSAYVLEPGYPQRPNVGYGSERSDGFSGFETPSHLRFTGTFDVDFPEWMGDGQDYWSAVIAVNFNQEFVSNNSWNGTNYSKLNGDELSVTIPDGGLTVTYITTTPIPEPAHAATLLAGVAAVACAMRRRRKQG